jgi:peptidoglycan/xylan/chitin deacetylase (PgdA/CDA1 family)
VPATLFPVVSFLGGPRRFGSVRAQALLDEDDGDPRTVPYDYMTWDELDEWVAAGGEIGGHTVTHPFLGQVDETSGRAEVRECRELLATRYGQPPAVFCYPFGDSSGGACRWVRDAGFLAAVTTLEGVVTRGVDPYLLPRLPAPRSCGAEFDDRLFGVYRYRLALRRVVGAVGT